MIKLKRAYESFADDDGYRVLVDKLWPRGLRKDEAHFDGWLKDIAPSDALRKWFGHEPARFGQFRKRYERELRSPDAEALLEDLARRASRGTVTLVYSAHDPEHNNAVVLAGELARRSPRAARARRPPKRAARVHP
jgi:uncharacterized protein YeaO (DUF488 family)